VEITNEFELPDIRSASGKRQLDLVIVQLDLVKGQLDITKPYTNNIICSTTLFNIVKLLNLEGIGRCAKDLQQVQGEYIVLGLNFI
jgi:hypothetical protein